MRREIQNPLIVQPNPESFCRAIIFNTYSKIVLLLLLWKFMYLSNLSNLSKKLSKFIEFIEKLFFDKWTQDEHGRQPHHDQIGGGHHD
jgi:hypothetical protein